MDAVVDLSPVTRLIRSVRERVEAIGNAIEAVAEKIAGTVAAAINALLPTVTEALAGALGAFGELASALIENLATVDELAAAWGTGLQTALLAGLPPGLAAAVTGAVGPVSDAVTGIGRRLTTGAGEPGDRRDIGRMLDELPPPLRLVAVTLSLAVAAASYGGAMHTADIETVSQRSRETVRSSLIPPGTLADLVQRDVTDTQHALDTLARHGYTDRDSYALLESAKRLLTPEQVLALYARGLLSRDETDSELGRNGLDEYARWRLRALAEYVVTPADVVMLAGREAFEPDQVRELQLDAELPSAYLDAAKRAGLPAEQARWYWYAHWQPMPLSYAYEALHRRVIDREQLDAVFRQHEVLPWVREALVQISYDLPGRVDLRRMHAAGVITTAEEAAGLERLGYAPEDAARLAELSARLATESARRKRVQAAAPIAAEIVQSYTAATMSRADAAAGLEALGLLPAEVDARLAQAEYDRERVRLDSLRDAVGRLYVSGHIDEAEARRRLSVSDLGVDEQEYLLAGWRPRREHRELTDAERSQRDLTRADVLAAYREHVITRDAAGGMLAALGYDAAETAALLDLDDARAARALIATRQSAVRALYVNRRIDEGQARDRLLALDRPAELIGELLEAWTVERDERSPDLPVAWLESLARAGGIPENELTEELGRRGYTDREIAWMLRLWGYREMVEQRRLDIAERRLEQQAALAREREARIQRLADARMQQSERLAEVRAERAAAAQSAAQAAAMQRLSRSLEARQASEARRLEQSERQLSVRLGAQAALQAERLSVQERLAGQRLALAERLSAATDERQQRTLAGQLDRLDRQIAAREASDARREAAAERLLRVRDSLAREREEREDVRARAMQQRRLLGQIVRDETRFGQRLEERALVSDQEARLAAGRAAALVSSQDAIRELIARLTASINDRLGALQ